MFPEESFHPAVSRWLKETFKAPTECQRRAWRAFKSGRHALVAAPTGSGKTLAAFLAAIDDLVRQSEAGQLSDETRILYISPLKALSHDIEKNLEEPLESIQRSLLKSGQGHPPIRAQSRTGDTPAATRRAMVKRPPHILVTTPESFYILLTSESGRRMLKTVRTVIVDEIHTLIGDKRGAHLALSLERLSHLGDESITRIGLSATQTPLTTVARFLLGDRPREACEIIDTGFLRTLDLDIVLPDLPLEAVLSQEAAKSLYDRMTGLIQRHRTTLVFVNTRRQAERVARALSERLGEDRVTSHHGSLARPQRLEAEHRLKAGELKALVATASLELGIDIGDVDLVCQLGITDSVATWLQRLGRAGHSLDRVPKGRLFPTSRDELVTALALVDAIRRQELEPCHIAVAHLDVLAQQIVAMCATDEWEEERLLQTVRRAAPYSGLSRETFTEILTMLAEGYATSRGRRGAYLYWDRIRHRLRGRRNARLTAITCGGAIPDTADYRVIVEPTGEVIGSVDEDFAIESLAGDIFQLGNNSWRVLRLERDALRVEDARGAPPSIPFWFGEAPGRSDVLAKAVSRLREEIFQGVMETTGGTGTGLKGVPGPDGRVPNVPGGIHSVPEERSLPSPPSPLEAIQSQLQQSLRLNHEAVHQAVEYLTAAGKALGTMPNQKRIVLERFFDEAGDLQLIIHSPYGSRVNRAWGLALRKRFCRRFNFELQAAATEDALLLSLGSGQSFPLEAVKEFLNSATVHDLLTQAVLDNPMFTARWRWNATVSLAVRRFRNGRRTPPYLIRIEAEDLVTAVFPDQLACLENIQGDREIPDHPLVRQTLEDCLHEAMDIRELERILRGIEAGEIQVVVRETVEPSPLAAEMLGARVYAFLDGAPLEERRVRAVSQRRWLDPETTDDLARLDPQAIEQVRRDIRPEPRDYDEMHDALLGSGYFISGEMVSDRQSLLDGLLEQGRCCRMEERLWIAAEHWPRWQAVFPQTTPAPSPNLPENIRNESWDFATALIEIVRARLSVTGPVTADRLTNEIGLPLGAIEQALLGLEQEGGILRGDFGWCERGLLARIHRLTLKTLRQAIEPVSQAGYLRFLLRWQHLHPDTLLEGEQSLSEILHQLEGYQATASQWETAILPARLRKYDPAWLDRLCLAGRLRWLRLTPSGKKTPAGQLSVAFIPRKKLGLWVDDENLKSPLSPGADKVLATLKHHGALFYDELVGTCRLLPSQLEAALAELLAQGQITADSFDGLRALLLPEAKKRRYKRVLASLENAGRWQCLAPSGETSREQSEEHRARCLLKRYGVVFRALAAKDPAMPSWLTLVRIYWRLETRGDIRGGRFVAGHFGEQFALPESVDMLRKAERQQGDPPITLSMADPIVQAVSSSAGPIPRQNETLLIIDGVPQLDHAITTHDPTALGNITRQYGSGGKS